LTQHDVAGLNARFRDAPPLELLAWAVDRFAPRLALASSFGLEDIVLIDMIAALPRRPAVFFLDTGRLHQETYETVDRVRARYGITVEVYAPLASRVEAMASENGYHHIYEDKAARLDCCAVRKVEPLTRALAGRDAWVTGLRREQTVSRAGVSLVEHDAAHGLLKLSPLAYWSTADVWAYAKERRLPYNSLHDRGFPSIGCVPCTRAVEAGEDIRAGRWWWEDPTRRECGLHMPAKEVRP
jgi:phosphoadenosine phosphosulfate reductase